MKKKAIKENPITTFRKINEARMGRVMASYPDPPASNSPLYDFIETFPVRKGIAGYSESYQPLQSWEEKKAAEKAQAQLTKEGNKSFRGHDRDLRKLKNKGKNLQNSPAKAGPHTTPKFTCTGPGCHG